LALLLCLAAVSMHDPRDGDVEVVIKDWLWTSSSRAGAEQPAASAWMLLHSTLRTLTMTDNFDTQY